MLTSSDFITIAENKWLKLLYKYSKQKFTQFPLPSHDHLHHLRVWRYARKILFALADTGKNYSLQEVESLLIAVFFHDLGMTITRDKSHGTESRNLCRQFFESEDSPLPLDLDSVLTMIEKHDDKEYGTIANRFDHPTIAAILNVSDDLDAFGNIGVYRYTEIYHFRGIKIEELPSLVLPNLDARFRHFSSIMESLRNLVDTENARFIRTRNFFLDLERELKIQNKTPGEFCKIVELLVEFSNSPGTNIHDFANQIKVTEPIINNFFQNLALELDEAISG